MVDLKDPWLVAVWPGMGSVALAAGSYLIEQLGAQWVHELPAKDMFDIDKVEVNDGVASASRLPRSMFFAWENPDEEGRDLLIFLGEAQPSEGGFAFCHRILDFAESQGVERFFTFAAMATQLYPGNVPRTFGVANEEELLDELEAYDVEILQDGQISGLNGVLLAAGADRGLEGICLLGELPFFAINVPNPKASRAVLRVFTELADIDVDFDPLDEQAEQVEKNLLEILDKMNLVTRRQAESEGFTVPEFAAQDQDEDEDEEEEETEEAPPLDTDARRKIEQLFREAKDDRSKAIELKRELDKHGVFKEYEDRFLDLFKKAE